MKIDDQDTLLLDEIFLQLEFERRWFPFGDYLKTLENFLANERKKLIDSVESDWKSGKIGFPEGWSEQQKVDAVCGVMGAIDYSWHRFGNTFRKSFLITMHASFEAFLVEECKSYAKVNSTKELGLTGRASILVKLLGYLTKERMIPPIDDQTREMLQEYTHIRDFITHADAKLENWKKNPERIKQIVNTTDGLEWLTPDEELVIEESYCYQTLDMVRSLAEIVYTKLHG